MKVVVIDDERILIKEYKDADVVHLKDAKSGLDYLQKSDKIDVLYLDHDLGSGGSGTDIANYLEWRAVIGEKLVIDRIMVHSMNPVGAARMAGALGRYYAVTIMRPDLEFKLG